MLLASDIQELRSLVTRIASSTAVRHAEHRTLSHSESVVATCAALAAVAQDVCRAFKTQYNSTVPINALPVELLGDVFRQLQTVVREERPQRNPLASVTRACLVCTHWRSVANNFPILWSHIEVKTYCSPLLLSAFLSRGRNVSLAMKDLDNRSSSIVTQYMDRLRVLQIVTASCMDAFMQAAPRLEILAVQYCEDGFNSGFLADHAPNLHTLILPHCSLKPDVQYPAFRAVTAVHANGVPPRGTSIVSLLINQCPRLTTLTGVADGFEVDDRASHRLRALRIMDSANLRARQQLGIANPLLELLDHRRIRTITLRSPIPATVDKALEGMGAISHLSIVYTTRIRYEKPGWLMELELADERGFVRTIQHSGRVTNTWDAAKQFVTSTHSSWALRSLSVAVPGLFADALSSLPLDLRSVESFAIGVASADDLRLPSFLSELRDLQDVHVTAVSDSVKLGPPVLAEFMRKLTDQLGQRFIGALYLDNITLAPDEGTNSPLAEFTHRIVKTDNSWQNLGISAVSAALHPMLVDNTFS